MALQAQNTVFYGMASSGEQLEMGLFLKRIVMARTTL